jgi:hypothetical protein
MQGAMERQVRGRWLTTTANAWARVTLDRFGRNSSAKRWPATPRHARRGPRPNSLDDGKPTTHPAHPALARHTGKDDTLAVSARRQRQALGTSRYWPPFPTARRATPATASAQVTPLQEKSPGKISRGDLWRVTLTIDADTT